LLVDEQIIVLPRVLLETEWVLWSRYGYSATQFLAFAEWLTGNPVVTFELPGIVDQALELHRGGFDFADALHLAAAGNRPFATFDNALLRFARQRGLDARKPDAN
jgi:predicted nucleic acid-binding protein